MSARKLSIKDHFAQELRKLKHNVLGRKPTTLEEQHTQTRAARTVADILKEVMKDAPSERDSFYVRGFDSTHINADGIEVFTAKENTISCLIKADASRLRALAKTKDLTIGEARVALRHIIGRLNESLDALDTYAAGDSK